MKSWAVACDEKEEHCIRNFGSETMAEFEWKTKKDMGK